MPATAAVVKVLPGVETGAGTETAAGAGVCAGVGPVAPPDPDPLDPDLDSDPNWSLDFARNWLG